MEVDIPQPKAQIGEFVAGVCLILLTLMLSKLHLIGPKINEISWFSLMIPYSAKMQWKFLNCDQKQNWANFTANGIVSLKMILPTEKIQSESPTF